MDFIDEHIYAEPLRAIDLAKQLDGRDRNGRKSVLAEYAIQTSSGFGNMRAAPAEPERIAPIKRQLPSVGSKFQYELEGNSFTVLKLKPEAK